MRKFFLTMGATITLVMCSLVSPTAANAQGTCLGTQWNGCWEPPVGTCVSNLAKTSGVAIDVSFVGTTRVVGGRLQGSTTYCSRANPGSFGSAISAFRVGVGYCVYLKLFHVGQFSPYGVNDYNHDFYGSVLAQEQGTSWGGWVNLPISYSYWLTGRKC